MKIDTSTAIRYETDEKVFVIRLTYDDGSNWYIVAWKDDNQPTLYSEGEFYDKFFICQD